MTLIQSKSYYKALPANGYKWYAQIMPGIHAFVTGDHQTGFKNLLIDEAGLTNGDLEFVTMHDLSLTEEEARKRSRLFVKQLKALTAPR